MKIGYCSGDKGKTGQLELQHSVQRLNKPKGIKKLREQSSIVEGHKSITVYLG